MSETTSGPAPDTVPATAARPETLESIGPVARHHHRRRPTGAAPPLPRSIGKTGRGFIVASVLVVAWVVICFVFEDVADLTTRVDAAVLRVFADLRTDWLTTILRSVNRISAGWTVTVAAVALLAAMVVFRRWRHLFTFLASVLALQLIGVALFLMFRRPRPFDVTIIGYWAGYSFPAVAVAVVTIIAVGFIYSMVVPGRARTIAKIVASVVIGLVILARLYLGDDHPTDVIAGAVLAVAIPVNAFRFFTPNEVFPVSYGRGKTAHLDVGGRRGEAIRQALRDQLGIIVTDIKPVGLAGSGGSTPIRLRVEGDTPVYLFGKVYTMNHVRADRWYKLGRTILYGRLEDEAPYHSVRRLVQFEDYALRLLQDLGIRSAAPAGIVELTPEREYLLVTEFFDGAVEIGDAEIDDGVIDQGLQLVRQLWDAGIAHRDIKPANLMVRDGELLVIDVAFMQIRPSPWRQAVDLANMMLVLAVRTDAQRVYQRALRLFTADEIAEAFAAARGIASPTQLRTVMKQDGRDLVAQFRAMTPPREPISLQRWGVRRVLLAVGLLVGGFIAAAGTFAMFTPAELQISGRPDCGTDDLMILVAQSVPSAALVPCISSLPAGWDVHELDVEQGRTRFVLEPDGASGDRVDVRLLPLGDCDVAGAVEVPSDELGAQQFERPERLPPQLDNTRYYLFDGGCVTYRMTFSGARAAGLVGATSGALSFQSRSELVRLVDDRTGLRLCGADAPPCPGGS